jgi:hypothetical protein
MQPNLKLVSPAPLAANWPDSGDVTDLLAVVEAQTAVIADQAALIDRYQAALNNAQAGLATGTGSSSASVNLSVTNVVGLITIGATVAGLNVPANTTIATQVSGPSGGAGTYTTNVATTLSNTPLTFTPSTVVATGTGTATGTSLAMTAVSGVIVPNATVSGAGVPANTTIVSQVGGTIGGNGTYTTNVATTATAVPLAFDPPPPPASAWPIPRDANTLNILTQQQTAVARTQSALIQHYQDVLNTSQTPMS